MRFKNSTALLSVSFAALTAAPALADITADDIWTSYQAVAQSIGGELTATATRDGNNVEFSNTKLHLAFPGGEGALDILYPRLSYTERGDGTVSMDMEGAQTYKFVVSGPNQKQASAEALINYDNSELIASGNPDDITFAYAMDGFTFEANNFDFGDMRNGEGGEFAISGSGSAMKGTSQLALGDLITLTGNSDFGNIAYTVLATDPRGSTSTTISSYQGMTGNSTITLPTGGMSIMNLAAALHQGLSINYSGTTNFNDTKTVVVADGNEISSQAATVGATTSAISANSDSIQLITAATDIAMEAVINEGMAISIDGDIDRMTADLRVPVSMSEEPQDFTLAFGLDGIKLSEGFWGMFDPAAILPRDAATLAMNLTGKTTLLQDLFNFEEMMKQSNDDIPAQLNELTINDLQISAVGASVSATGDFAFNNDDLTSFDGMPAPSGSADLQITGANGLIDKLIELGFVEESDAIGARMMMGMFTVAGDSEDTLKSSLEITEDGQITANGQRIK
jgi:hypothetical protein